MLAESLTQPPRHASVAGDGKIPNTSLFSVQTELSIVGSYLRRPEHSGMKRFYRQQKVFEQ